MNIQILASGSSGNAAILHDGETTILLDAGISMRRTRYGLESLGLGFDDLDAILITHEHSDHIKGLSMIRKHHRHIPVYTSIGTCAALELSGDIRFIKARKAFEVGGWTCRPYKVSHDASEPLGFRFETSEGVHVGWATDLGYWDDEVAEHLDGCHMLMLEANHDPDMLQRGPYPYFLKRRVSSRRGHLSNIQARWLLDEVADVHLEQVILGHLSEKNNDPELAASVLSEPVKGSDVRVLVAERKQPTTLLHVPRLPEDEPVEEPASGQISLF